MQKGEELLSRKGRGSWGKEGVSAMLFNVYDKGKLKWGRDGKEVEERRKTLLQCEVVASRAVNAPRGLGAREGGITNWT